MPTLRGHIKQSVKRTGKEFRELNEWMDGSSVGYRDRIERHKIPNIPKFAPVVERLFGKEAVNEYLQHLKDDYEDHIAMKIIMYLKGWKIDNIFKYNK
jgi:hypothetical protein